MYVFIVRSDFRGTEVHVEGASEGNSRRKHCGEEGMCTLPSESVCTLCSAMCCIVCLFRAHAAKAYVPDAGS